VVAAVKAGAVLAGSNETGFWAVWQDDAAQAYEQREHRDPNWSFATRIFLYEIRIAP
jgi:hypothetical protein